MAWWRRQAGWHRRRAWTYSSRAATRWMRPARLRSRLPSPTRSQEIWAAGGFMLIRLADGRAVAIDYRETAPAAAGQTMYQDSAGNVIPNASLDRLSGIGRTGNSGGAGTGAAKVRQTEMARRDRAGAAVGGEWFCSQPRDGSKPAGGKIPGAVSRKPTDFPARTARFTKRARYSSSRNLRRHWRACSSRAARDFYEGRTARTDCRRPCRRMAA